MLKSRCCEDKLLELNLPWSVESSVFNEEDGWGVLLPTSLFSLRGTFLISSKGGSGFCDLRLGITEWLFRVLLLRDPAIKRKVNITY